MREFFKKYDILGWTMAISAAILLWMYVITLQNPEITVNRTVSLQVAGANQLSKENLSVIGDVPETVSLQLRGRRDKIAQLTEKNGTDEKVVALLNLGSIYKAGDYKLGYTVTVDIDGVSVVQKSPSQININVDQIVTEKIPIDIVFNGEMPLNFKLDQYSLSQKTVSLQGPKKHLEKVKQAVVAIDKGMLTKSTETEVKVKLLNEKGEEVSDSYIIPDINYTVFKAEVHKVGTVPLKVSVVPMDAIPSEMISVSILPETIELKGSQEAVDGITQIDLGEIYLSKCLENNEFEIVMPVKLPDGITTDVTSMAATVSISIKGMEKKEFSIPSERILPVPGYKYLDESINITVFVKAEDIDKILPEDILITPVYNADEFANDTLQSAGISVTSSKYKIASLGKYTLKVGKITE